MSRTVSTHFSLIQFELVCAFVMPNTSVMDKLSNLKSKLPNRLYELLQKVGIENAHDIIMKSNTELQDLAPFSSSDLKLLKNAAAEVILCMKPFLTGLENHMNICYHAKKIKIGCPLIDKIMDGGFTCKGITEISGESGTGKTQICLQLSIMVQFPEEIGGLDAGAVFICTEDVFPSKRLQQMFQTFPPAFRKRYRQKTNFMTQFADNIYIEHASDSENLVKIICKDVPLLMANRKVGLVVVDSIAAVFRIEGVSPKRSNMMRSIAITLHKLAKNYQAIVICINQVSSNIHNGALVPCLGLSWANLVTTRIQLHHNFENNQMVNKQKSVRTFRLISSSHIPSNSILYEVTKAGISGVYN